MKAVYVKNFGGVENLEIREIENPSPPLGNEVLINVKAAGLNRADLLQRRGLYPAPAGSPPNFLGLEFAGVVAETGEKAAEFAAGDRVFGIAAGGAQAEFLLSDQSLLVRIPENLSFTEAAAVPEAFITAHDAIFTQGDLRAGETLLVHAVGSGVGLAALQMAKAHRSKVVGTSRTPNKLEKCFAFGLDHAIATEEISPAANPEKFAEILRGQTGGTGADVVLDLVGAAYLAANLECLNLKGRLVLVGTPAGTRAELNLNRVMTKRLKIVGTVLRSRPLAEKAEATRLFVRDVLPLLAGGEIKPNVDRVFDIAEVRAAHEHLESDASFGKVVLEF